MPNEGEPTVSNPQGGGPSDPSGQDTNNPAASLGDTKPGDNTTPNPPPPSSDGKQGFDALPDYAKDIIRRQSAKAKAAEAELEATKARLQELETKAPIDDEDAERVEEFRRLANKAGYYSKAEVEDFLSQEKRRDQDKRELDEVLKEFDGTNMPKITEEDLAEFLKSAKDDPRRQYLLYAPFREVARTMKAEEIRQKEVDRILEQGGHKPPKIEGGSGTDKQPHKTVKRYGNLAEMQADLRKGLFSPGQ